MPEAQKEQQPEVRAASKENLISEVYTGQAEISYKKSGYVPESFDEPYNPDDLFQKTNDYSIYEDMVNDDQISVCLQIKKDLVIGSGWDIVVGEDSELQDQIKTDLKKILSFSYKKFLPVFKTYATI